MKQEEKQLLLKDLCARQLFGIKICYTEFEYGCKSVWDIEFVHPCGKIICKHPYAIHDIENCQLYLRPMSSMTEEEKVQLSQYACIGEDLNGEFIDEVQRKDCAAYIDWLNAHHFDYRGLIEKGLALEAPEGMYEY